jgi:anaerobic magnesium-protoporphyrin IX monomethyl ester cyclase
MKVQFIWPNFDCPIGKSVGVAYLSGALKRAGHDTRILHICEWLDYPFDLDRIESDVRAYEPDLIAFSTGFAHYPEMGQTAARLKKAVSKPILFGGIHTTLNTMAVMKENPWIDFANVGEGDDSILDLVTALDKGGDTTSILNVWARKDGKIIANASRRLKDITVMPWMDLDGWPQFQKITDNRRGWVNVYMNRGCPYRCTYCHNNGVAKVLQESFQTKTSSNADLGYLRLRGIDDMLGELKSIMEKFDNVKAFSFNDDTFTMDQEYMKEFLSRYKKEIGLPWICNTTVLDVDKEMLEVMKDANCDLVRFGVETATLRIKREILKRDFSVKKTEEVFRICREIGLRSFAFNIIANPTETREEMRDTLRLNSKLLPDGLKVSLGYPFPGTEYHAIAQKLELIDESRHIHNFIHDTKLKWSDEDRLWIDKVRCVYWWWMNVYLENEASPLYAELVKMIEAMLEEEWLDPETERRMWDLDDALSTVLKQRNITHYTIPFKDRPEISILHLAKPTLNQEVLDPH